MSTTTQQNVPYPLTPEETALRDLAISTQTRNLNAQNAELDRQGAQSPGVIRDAATSILNDANLTEAQKQAKISGLMRQYGVTATQVADATGYTAEQVTQFTGVNLTTAERNASSQQELLDIAVRNARQGTNATPEQITQIDAATGAAQTAGEININRFRDETLARINEEVAAASGLMPGDTPIAALNDRAGAEVIRQQGALTANLAGANANARLNYPLAAQGVQTASINSASNLNLATQNFQRDLEQTAANNRYRLFSSPYAGNTSQGLTANSLNLGTTNQSTNRPNTISDYGQMFGGLGSLVSGASRLFG